MSGSLLKMFMQCKTIIDKIKLIENLTGDEYRVKIDRDNQYLAYLDSKGNAQEENSFIDSCKYTLDAIWCVKLKN